MSTLHNFLFHMMMLDGAPQKSCFSLVTVDDVLISFRMTSWYFYLFPRFVNQSSVKCCPSNSLWLTEKTLAFSFSWCLDLRSSIIAFKTNKDLLYMILLNSSLNIAIDCADNSFISTLQVLHCVDSYISYQIFDTGSMIFNTFWCIFCNNLSSEFMHICYSFQHSITTLRIKLGTIVSKG